MNPTNTNDSPNIFTLPKTTDSLEPNTNKINIIINLIQNTSNVLNSDNSNNELFDLNHFMYFIIQNILK